MRFLLSKTGLALVAFLALAAYLLWTEHRAHLAAVGPALPWLLLALCPLIHLFLHRGHGADPGREGGADAAADAVRPPDPAGRSGEEARDA